MSSSGERRKQIEARKYRRSMLIASLSTLASLVAVYFIVPLAPGWDKVKASFFDWEVFTETFPILARAFLLDIAMFLWCTPLILGWSLVLALMRDARSPALQPLRLFAIGYSDLFRGVPIILVIYLFGFGIPGLGLPRPWNSPYIWGTVAMVLSYSAYVAEVYRSGIESVHESQRAAATSLSMTETDIMRYVILPQAVRKAVPNFMNNLISLQKDVALLSFLGPVEVLRQAGSQKSLLANFTPYIGAAILFLLVTVPATRWVDRSIARQNRERR